MSKLLVFQTSGDDAFGMLSGSSIQLPSESMTYSMKGSPAHRLVALGVISFGSL